jgi:hypothetical protein
MPKKRYVNKLSPEQKASEMLQRYGQKDAIVQVKQILCFIESKDVRTMKYWDEVHSLLTNTNFAREKEKYV